MYSQNISLPSTLSYALFSVNISQSRMLKLNTSDLSLGTGAWILKFAADKWDAARLTFCVFECLRV